MVRLTQYNGIREAACRLHDEHVAVGNVCPPIPGYRMKPKQDLHQTLLDAPDEWFHSLTSQEQAVTALKEIAGETVAIEEGGLNLWESIHSSTGPAVQKPWPAII